MAPCACISNIWAQSLFLQNSLYLVDNTKCIYHIVVYCDLQKVSYCGITTPHTHAHLSLMSHYDQLKSLLEELHYQMIGNEFPLDDYFSFVSEGVCSIQ